MDGSDAGDLALNKALDNLSACQTVKQVAWFNFQHPSELQEQIDTDDPLAPLDSADLGAGQRDPLTQLLLRKASAPAQSREVVAELPRDAQRSRLSK